MYKYILPILTCLAIGLTGCKQNTTINDALITASVSAGTSAGLKLAVKDDAKRVVIARYLNTYASALRTISGDPTDEQLTQQLLAFIPADVAAQYPELATFAVPLIVQAYDYAKAKYGSDSAQLREVLNDVATGIETGSAIFLH